MPDPTRATDDTRSARRWLVARIAVVVVVLLAALLLVRPSMPDRIVLLTGPEGSAYHALGVHYAETIRARGLAVDVVVTDGALDNLRRLAGTENTVAFAPTVIEPLRRAGIDLDDLVTFGSVDVEPLWVFHRADAPLDDVAGLDGGTIVTGGAESVSDLLMRAVLDLNGIEDDVVLEDGADRDVAALARALTDGTIDAIAVTGRMTAPVAATLLAHDGVAFHAFTRADAYAGRLRGLMVVEAPEGVFDLARNVPDEDARLLATATCLVARDGLHHAVVPLLLGAAETAQASAAWPAPTGFPTDEHVALPLDGAARRYFNQGERGLGRVLPYGVIRFLNHLGFFVLPLLTGLALLLKAAPTALRMWTSTKLTGAMKQLARIEKAHAGGADGATLHTELDGVDRATAEMFVPRSCLTDYLGVRQAIHDLRDRLG